MVDSAAVASLVGAGDPLPVQAAIEKAISAALGADTVRGDTVVVTFLPFAPVAEIPEVTASPVPVELVVQGGVAMAVVVAAFVFLVRPLLQAVRPAQAAAPAAARVAAAAAASAAAAAAAAVAEPEPELAPPLDFTARLRAQLNRVQPHDPHDLSELVRHEPALAAEVVRRWIQRP
jgi:flagellar biosynthesis/type III secretory pathway M-ring protein FliF/YscJ